MFLLLVIIPPVTHVISVIFVLQKNTTLKKLFLRGNNIGDVGGTAIAKALEVSPVSNPLFALPVWLPPPGNLI